MATTKKKLSEQVIRRLSGGDRSVGSKWHPLEIQEAIMQVLNSMLRPQYFETLQLGETIPEGCVLANYEDIAVTSWNGISKSTLPAIPVSLPKNLGVFRISKSGDPLSNDFIPIPQGQYGMVVTQRLLSDLIGDVIGYEVRGKEIWYTVDLTAQSPATNAVTMQLVVMDLSLYSESELLPINADQEAKVIEAVLQMFSQSPTQPAIIDSTSDTK